MLPYRQLLRFNKTLNTPVYLQLVNNIIKEINKGRLAAGLRMPGTREMASLLGLNRKTVTIAYDELMAQGWLEIKPSRGTFVSEALPEVKYQEIDPGTKRVEGRFEQCGFPLTVTISETESPDIKHQYLEIDEGSPDERLAPIATIYKYCRSLVKSGLGRRLLKYQDEKGDEILRKTLARYLAETRGLSNDIENIMITRGSQMAIYLAFQVLLSKGDNVVVGSCNYAAANESIIKAGGKLISVEVDEHGINIEALKSICLHQKIKGIYITPHHHFPTTVTLNAERRIALLKLAEQYKFAIIEDDYDYDFHYASNPILPLASMDRKGLVIYIGAFSKLLAPAIRVGYLAGPRQFIQEIAKLRRNIDRQGDPIMERAIALMIKDGEIQRHLKKSLNIYRTRKDFCCQLLRQEIGKYINFSTPEGGMVVWIKFNNDIDINHLATALKKQYIFINTQKEFVKPYNAIRFGFASLNEEEIKKAVLATKSAIKEIVK